MTRRTLIVGKRDEFTFVGGEVVRIAVNLYLYLKL